MSARPDPYGNDDEFRAYMRRENWKIAGAFLLIILMGALTIVLS